MKINKLKLIPFKECPYCKVGIINYKTSRYGEFLGCDNFPRCGATENIKEDLDVGQVGYKEN